jgi:hypothetical protein
MGELGAQGAWIVEAGYPVPAGAPALPPWGPHEYEQLKEGEGDGRC